MDVRLMTRQQVVAALPALALWIGAGVVWGQPTTEAPAVTTPAGTASTDAPVDKYEAQRIAGDDAYRDGDYDKAITTLSLLLAELPNDHVALYLRGSARVELGTNKQDAAMIREGIADARAAITELSKTDEGLNADYYLPYLYGMSQLAAVENRKEHAEQAIKIAQQVLGRTGIEDFQKANLYYQKALLHTQLNQINEAGFALQSAIDKDPEHLAAHVALCDMFARNNSPEDAKAQFDRSIALLPEEPLLYNNRGMFLQSVGRKSEAVADFDKALQLNPELVAAWTNRGFTRLQAAEAVAAEADLNKSIELDATQHVPWSLRASARLQQGKMDAALADFRKVIEMQPNMPSAHYDLGFALFFNKDYAKASESFNEAVRLNPSMLFLEPWRYTSMVFAGQQEEAAKVFAPIAEKKVEDRVWFDILTLYVMGKLEDSEVLMAVKNTDPAGRNAQMCEAYYFIGLRTASRKDAEGAKAFFEQALATNAIPLSAYRGAQYALQKFSKGE